VRNNLLLDTLAVLALTSGSINASAQSDVKAALLDMSAMVGMGTVGMMGPGTMSNGKMGPGMASGNMGNSMTGMMGMMGVMAVRIDHNPIKAGEVAFDVTNWSRSTVHKIAVVAVDSPSSQLPFDYSQSMVREDQIKILGETSELQPNESKTLHVHLQPGTYMLFCNVPGHYAWGMATTLEVMP
jgi:uncharacterized cupredoxin-like copper-binding protein